MLGFKETTEKPHAWCGFFETKQRNHTKHDLKDKKLPDLSLKKRSVKDGATQEMGWFQRNHRKTTGWLSKKPENHSTWFQRKHRRWVASHGFKESTAWFQRKRSLRLVSKKPIASLGFKETDRFAWFQRNRSLRLVSKKPQRELLSLKAEKRSHTFFESDHRIRLGI